MTEHRMSGVGPRHDLMLDAIGEAVIATDLTGVITYWNAAAERLYGWRSEEVIGRNIVDVTPTSASREDAEAIMASLSQGQTWHGRFDVRRRDGEVFPALVTDAPLLDADGRLVGIIGVSVDLSEELAHRADARRGRQQVAISRLARVGLETLAMPLMLEHAVDTVAEELAIPMVAVLAEDRDPDLLTVRACRGWGDAIRPGDAVPATVLLPVQGSMDGMFEDLARLPSSHRSPLLDQLGVRAGLVASVGRDRDEEVLVAFSPEPRRFDRDEQVFLESVASVLASVRARVVLEDELRTAIDRLRTSEEIRLAFLRATSHELRTPLAAILGVAETMEVRDGVLSEDERASFVRILGTNASRLDRLIADLLDVDRLASGLVEAARRPCELDGVVAGITQDIEHPAHRLVLDLEPVELAVDVPKIERVVHNLVVNALRHTPEGGEVAVRLRAVSDGAQLVVEDGGRGIPEAYLDRIFEPLVQGPELHRSPSPGTGVGLALVREIVELHGGEVSASNRAQGGARFEVHLPQVEVVRITDPVEAHVGHGAAVD